MPRIAGIDIPDHKKVAFSLRSIYGVGPKLAKEILNEAKIDSNKRAKELTGEEVNKIQRILEKHVIAGNLKRMVRDNIDRLKRIRSYRGMRHTMGLPTRGQRTRTNARTKRGSKKTIGALSKEAAAKLEAAKK